MVRLITNSAAPTVALPQVKGMSMPAVVRLDHDGASDPPKWETVKNRLAGLKDGGSISLGVDDDTWLIVLFVGDLGYLVTGFWVSDKEYFTLIDRRLGDDPVTAFDGGDTREFPRYTFVSESLMLRAVEAFFLTGERDPTCEWVHAEDAVY